MPRSVIFTTTARMPALAALSTDSANRIMALHHAEATRRGLPVKMSKVRAVREGRDMVYCLDYRAPRP